MKQKYFIVFISLTVFVSFGFRQCEWVIPAIFGIDVFSIFGKRQNQFIQPVEGSNVFQILVGEQGKIFTSDGFGPAEWVERQSGTTEKLNFINSWEYSEIPDAFAIGDNGTVLYSSNRGYNWENKSIPSLNKNLYGCTLFEGATVPAIAVCGDDGILYVSTDGGSNWDQFNTITTNKLNSMMTYGIDNFVCVGENGTIIKGGPQFGWYDKSVDPNVQLYRIFAGIDLSWSKLWVVGSGGKIYYSSDYGNSWGQQISGTTADLYDVKFRSSDEGMVVGAGGVVRYTSNGGLTWLSHPEFDALTDGDIYSLSVVDTNIGTAVVKNYTESRGGGTLILTVSSEQLVGVDDNDGQIPSEFHLKQNYPNPFNLSTRINYAIPQSGYVSLKVYDALGEEVATLVNEEKLAGSYEINFDASGLTSGIYFYKLKVGNEFTETKKLVLMK